MNKITDMISLLFNFFKERYYLLTAVLMYLSFPTYDIFILKAFPLVAWFSLIPLFLYVRKVSMKKVYIIAFITFFWGNLLTFEWIGNFAGSLDGYMVITGALIPVLSVIFALRIFIAEALSRKLENLRFVIYPSVWLFFDAMHTIGYLAFPWTLWGHTQYTFTPVVQLASITGISGITFLVVMGNTVFSEYVDAHGLKKIFSKENLLSGQGKKFLAFLSGVFVIILIGSLTLFSKSRPVKKEYTVATVQTCISPWDNWRLNKNRNLRELIKYTNSSLVHDPNFIIWSESATLEYISWNYQHDRVNEFQHKLFDYIRSIKKPLLTGEVGVTRIRRKFGYRLFPQNNAVLIDKDGQVLKTYPKINLVPFGEWFPYEKWFPVVKELADKYGASSFVPGKGPELFSLDGYNFGVLVCYEGIFYRLCRKYKQMGAHYLINITNDGWTDKYRGHMQHFSASVFRAVENGLWLVRAGNTGYSAVIDPYGRIKSSMPILEKGYMYGHMDFSFNHKTFYQKYGDVFLNCVLIFIFIVIILYVVKTIEGKKSAGNKN
jgi:apolipoprotein N-acyltransferase